MILINTVTIQIFYQERQGKKINRNVGPRKMLMFLHYSISSDE